MEDLKNPFACRGRIENSNHFWGRKEEIRDIKTRLHTMQSVSIVGSRRIGKSSLLFYFYNHGNALLNNSNYRFIYITLENVKSRRLVPFLNQILKGIHVEKINEEKNIVEALTMFTEKIEQLKNIKAIVLLDEFDNFSKLRNEFPASFFDQMRSLLQGGRIAMVTSSKASLQRFTVANKISPFYNIFGPITLGSFSKKERENFISHNWNGFRFTPEENNLINSFCEDHPLKLQIICYHFFKQRESSCALPKLKKDIKREIKAYFFSVKDYLMKAQNYYPSKENLVFIIDCYRKIRGKE